MNTVHLGTAAIAIACACAAARAADGESLADLVKAGTVDMPLTTSPAAFMLGASGENVPRLASFRMFSTQAARAFDEKGNVANAMAVELAPALAIGRMTWSDVTSSAANRILSRTTVSFAAKPKDGDAPAQSALGLQAVLWAPEMDAVLATVDKHKDCFQVVRMHDPSLPGSGPSDNTKLSDAQNNLIEACQKVIDGQLTKWNQSMVALGIGHAFVNPQGVQTTTKASTAFWLTAAYGGDLGAKASDAIVPAYGWLVTAHVRRTSNVPSTAEDGTSTSARLRLAGINARFGTKVLAGIAEISVTKASASGFGFADRHRAVLGLQYRIASDLYLTAGVAHDTGAPAEQQSMLANLSWGFSQQSVLAAQ